MNLRKLRREHTLIFVHTASSAETQGGFASKTIRVGSGRVGSGDPRSRLENDRTAPLTDDSSMELDSF
jgi:hypothetical protein